MAQNPHHTLSVLYGKILRTLQNMPEDAAYRRYTEQIIKERALAVTEVLVLIKYVLVHIAYITYSFSQQEKDITKLEKRINCGQVEELIVQAENELTLSRKMQAWKPWEPLVSEPPANQWKWPI